MSQQVVKTYATENMTERNAVSIQAACLGALFFLLSGYPCLLASRSALMMFPAQSALVDFLRQEPVANSFWVEANNLSVMIGAIASLVYVHRAHAALRGAGAHMLACALVQPVVLLLALMFGLIFIVFTFRLFLGPNDENGNGDLVPPMAFVASTVVLVGQAGLSLASINLIARQTRN